MFSIDSDKVICYTDESRSGALNFSTQAGLQTIADREKWTREDLEAIWNDMVGAVPFDNLKPVKKFRNRSYGIRQLWNAIQRLAPSGAQKPYSPPPAAPVKPEPKKAAKAKKPAKSASVKAPRPKKEKPCLVAGEQGRHAAKREIVMECLHRTQGVSIEELMTETGWLRHSCRGYISTLASKHGVAIQKHKEENRGTVYSA